MVDPREMSFTEQQTTIAEAIERFPDEFGLCNFPGKKFCIVQSASYFGSDGLMLYTYVWNDESNKWLAFAKGTERELRREIVAL